MTIQTMAIPVSIFCIHWMAAHKNIKNTNVNLTENISNGWFGPIINKNKIKPYIS